MVKLFLLTCSLFVSSTAAATLTDCVGNLSSDADYVIVGGGPAGLVLAERLSRNGQNSVILLEAGPETFNSTLLNTPAYFPFIAQPLWNFTAEPDHSLGGISPLIPQGRVLGGGTAVNGMAYCRGAASVFDEWASISGNEGLSSLSLFQDFLEVSHYTDPPAADYEQYVNLELYGNGPLEISRSSGMVGYEAAFSKAVQSQLGLREADLNGIGIGIDRGVSSVFARNRTRSYAGNTFAPLLSARPNVQVLCNAWANKIGFSGTRAINVTYQSNGGAFTINGKEIIISAGAINTPKLLMLSGVGSRDELNRLGIPVVAHRPEIGSNLRDHALSIVQLLVAPEVITVWQWAQNSTEAPLIQNEYITNASGPLGWTDGFVFATFRVPDSVFEGLNSTHFTSLPKDRPHILIQLTTTPFIPTVNSSAVTAWASLVQPEATGRVTLKSSNYQDDPKISTNWYGTAADKAAITWGYKQLREVLNREPLQKLITQEVFPGPGVTSDQDIWAAIQKQTYSFRHPVGTVAIGTALDSNWRLRGLEGIRVVDSSTFPFPTTCHPQSVVYALADRAGKDILEADSGSHYTIRDINSQFQF
ncbi:putative GMC oxidoreductase [Xylaria scruposa]|nr:putative GMC oxidoreductase [Xylaria scruposa]